MKRIRSTTILAVRRNGQAAIGGDGQVTLGAVVMKSDAHKIRRLYNGRVVVGFAGASADAFALLERSEAGSDRRLFVQRHSCNDQMTAAERRQITKGWNSG